ncbi:hypothetical protein EV421DRAFT_1222759 [Armillaria borealis]|uniref:Uncharacterized protein n=1 Tax=Armillaria borealis TaxID=47425 RepID=A0AA39MJ23_9AGAR|nr:hypothetical protein EV421DRAFT_1222759 [Armillaria borealis]
MTCQASSSADPCQYSGRKFRVIPFCAGSVSTRYACQKRCHCFSITIIRTGAIVSRPISIKRTPPLGVPSKEDSLFIPIKRTVRLFRRGESQGRFGSYDLSTSFPNCVQHIFSALIRAILPSKSITFVFACLCCYSILQWLPTTSSHAAVFLGTDVPCNANGARRLSSHDSKVLLEN